MVQRWRQSWCRHWPGSLCRCRHRRRAPNALLPSNNQKLEEAILLTMLQLMQQPMMTRAEFCPTYLYSSCVSCAGGDFCFPRFFVNVVHGSCRFLYGMQTVKLILGHVKKMVSNFKNGAAAWVATCNFVLWVIC